MLNFLKELFPQKPKWIVTHRNFWNLPLEEKNLLTGEYRYYELNGVYLSSTPTPGPHPRWHEGKNKFFK